MKQIQISVVIANYNNAGFLKNCLDSILQEKNKQYEIVVVNDASTDDSGKILGEYKTLKHFSLINLKRNVGAAKARNIGVKESRGEYIFFLDVDTQLETGWFDEIVSFFKQYKNAGIAQVKLLRMNSNIYDYAGDYITPFYFLSERAQSAVDKGQYDEISPVFSGKSAGMIVNKKAFNDIGGFDEDFKIYYEDSDLCWRAWLYGYYVFFLPTITVYHTYVAPGKKDVYYAQSNIAYFGSRNMIMSIIKNLQLHNLFLRLPIHVASWMIVGIIKILKGDLSKGSYILKAVAWNLIHLPKIIDQRKEIQNRRKLSDEELFQIVGVKKEISYYLQKGWAYINGRPF